MFDNSFVL